MKWHFQVDGYLLHSRRYDESVQESITYNFTLKNQLQVRRDRRDDTH